MKLWCSVIKSGATWLMFNRLEFSIDNHDRAALQNLRVSDADLNYLCRSIINWCLLDTKQSNLQQQQMFTLSSKTFFFFSQETLCLSFSLPVFLSGHPSISHISVPTLSLKAACLSLSTSISSCLSIHFFCSSFIHLCGCLSLSACLSFFVSLSACLSLAVCLSLSLPLCLCQTLLFQCILFKVELMPVKSGGKLLLWSTVNLPLKFHLWLKQRSITSERVFCSDRWWEEITLTSMTGVCAEVRGRIFQGEQKPTFVIFFIISRDLWLDLPSWLKNT